MNWVYRLSAAFHSAGVWPPRKTWNCWKSSASSTTHSCHRHLQIVLWSTGVWRIWPSPRLADVYTTGWATCKCSIHLEINYYSMAYIQQVKSRDYQQHMPNQSHLAATSYCCALAQMPWDANSVLTIMAEPTCRSSTGIQPRKIPGRTRSQELMTIPLSRVDDATCF